MTLNGSFLLDTNILIAFLNGHTAISNRFAVLPALNIPVIAAGELLYGARNSARAHENLPRYQAFIATCRLLDVSGASAEIYSRIKLELKLKGRPIPENDVWIAALALEHGMVLVTRDHDFSYLDDLVVQNWYT